MSRIYTVVTLVLFSLLLLTCDVFSFNMVFSARSFYSNDYLRWSFPSEGVDIRSELTWRNVQVVGFELDSEFFIKKKYYLNFSFTYGFIVFGRVQDSDYNVSNRGLEFSRSISNAGSGNIISASLSFGEPIYLTDFNFVVIPLVGLLFKRHEFRMFEGYQMVSGDSGNPNVQILEIGPIPGLDSSYITNWFGLWFGLDFDYKPFSFWSISFLLKLSVLYYYAYGNWNLRDNFAHPISFIHQSVGFGNYISVRNYFYINTYFSVSLAVFFDGMFCGPEGFKSVIYSEGFSSNVRYNGVLSTSFGITIGFNICCY